MSHAQLGLFGDRPQQMTPREAGHEAAKLAAERAEREIAEWNERAYAAFIQYAQAVYPKEFITKNAREHAEGVQKVPRASEPRAWGAIAIRAKNAKAIEYVGKYEAPHVHGGTVSVWRWKPA